MCLHKIMIEREILDKVLKSSSVSGFTVLYTRPDKMTTTGVQVFSTQYTFQEENIQYMTKMK